jgi:hypothetical protein
VSEEEGDQVSHDGSPFGETETEKAVDIPTITA